MARCFYSGSDAEFLAGSQNFTNQIQLSPTEFGLTAEQATAYAALNTAYAAAYTAATDPPSRTSVAIAIKNAAKAEAKSMALDLSDIIRATPTVPESTLIGLGIAYDTERTPVPPPAHAPTMDLLSVNGWTVMGKLHDATEPDRRGKPLGVAGAAIVSYVGDEPPASAADWKFEGNISRTSFQVTFPETVPAGARVWLAAYWFNRRMQSGPACNPQSRNLEAGGLADAA